MKRKLNRHTLDTERLGLGVVRRHRSGVKTNVKAGIARTMGNKLYIYK
jgi:hypothetical protein